jgi:hypothetical protein
MCFLQELVRQYAPHVYFDENEPFLPIAIGCTVFGTEGDSPSFGRKITFDDESVKFAIEYAFYWDYDIEHLYDLEHVWVYVDKTGQICECEGSFHGDYLRSLLKDRSNIEEETHIRVYSQPGKHAFLPSMDCFDLLPKQYLYAPAWEYAGSGGVLVPDFLSGQIETDDRKNELVRQYMQRFRFRPSMRFRRQPLDDNLFIPWETLQNQIPGFMRARLEEMERS